MKSYIIFLNRLEKAKSSFTVEERQNTTAMTQNSPSPKNHATLGAGRKVAFQTLKNAEVAPHHDPPLSLRGVFSRSRNFPAEPIIVINCHSIPSIQFCPWSRMIVGYAIGRSIDARLTVTALRAAINRKRPPPGCIHHSDRGSQYAAEIYRQLFADQG
ncbi:DDE-type integrase/transposase/recombinase [Mesorhizobium sp. ORM16]|uniref:DDE-type integrase/transposase/recombinase n=1 Tax=Mesorhizobium sp. ORM16 TaxID=3376989 RepID=UPI003857A1CD